MFNKNKKSTGTEKQGFEPLSNGFYDVTIREFKEKEAKNGKGSYIEADLEVTSGPMKGRRLWHKFLVNHVKSNVKEIGLSQLDSMVKAAGYSDGISGISDNEQLDELSGKTVRIKVAIQPPSNGFPAQNKITSFYEAA